MLIDLKQRGFSFVHRPVIRDESLSFWAAFNEIFPETKRQRCWVYKTANILYWMLKSIQQKAKSMIYVMCMATTKGSVQKAYNLFINTFESKYPKAVECLRKDKEDLFAFYDFTTTHWIHICTTNPIESTFAAVKLREKKTKGCGSRKATLSMVFILTMESAKTWKKLKGHQLILLVIENRKFVDGELAEEAAV